MSLYEFQKKASYWRKTEKSNLKQDRSAYLKVTNDTIPPVYKFPM